MGKKVYTINGKMFIINDETGEIETVHIDKEQPSPNDMKEIIKILAQNQKKETE
jgi:hypothetical protein